MEGDIEDVRITMQDYAMDEENNVRKIRQWIEGERNELL